MKYYIIHEPGKHPKAFVTKPVIECDFIETLTMDEHKKALKDLEDEILVLKARIRLARQHLYLSDGR